MGEHFGNACNAVEKLEKDRKLPRPMFDHAKVVKDAMLIFNWWTFEDGEVCHDNLKSNYEGIFFAGNKVLKKNVENEVTWFKALSALCEACYKFLEAREGNIWMWTGKDSGDAEAFFAGACKDGPSAPTSAPQKATPAPVEEKKVEKPVVKAPPKKVVKPATINENMIRKEWVLENYKEGVVTIEEDAWDDDTGDRKPGCTYQQTIKIFDCQNTTFIINGKCKAIQLDNCKKC